MEKQVGWPSRAKSRTGFSKKYKPSPNFLGTISSSKRIQKIRFEQIPKNRPRGRKSNQLGKIKQPSFSWLLVLLQGYEPYADLERPVHPAHRIRRERSQPLH